MRPHAHHVAVALVVLASGSAPAFGQEPGASATSARRLPRELPTDPATWPAAEQHRLLRLRSGNGYFVDAETTARAEHRDDVERLARAGLDGAVEDADLKSDDVSRWPVKFRLFYLDRRAVEAGENRLPALSPAEVAAGEAKAKEQTRQAYAREQDFKRRIGGSFDAGAAGSILEGPAELSTDLKDWPATWRRFLVEHAEKIRGGWTGLSDENALKIAAWEVRTFYYPENKSVTAVLARPGHDVERDGIPAPSVPTREGDERPTGQMEIDLLARRSHPGLALERHLARHGAWRALKAGAAVAADRAPRAPTSEGATRVLERRVGEGVEGPRARR